MGMFSALFFGVLGEMLMRVHYESQGLEAFDIDRVDDSSESHPGGSWDH